MPTKNPPAARRSRARPAGRTPKPAAASTAPAVRLDRGQLLVLLGEAAVFLDRLYSRLAEAHGVLLAPAHPDRAWVDAGRLAEVFPLLDDLADWLMRPVLVTPAALPPPVAAADR